ncbi:hypothetical protein [Acinetobacter sp. ANC 3813]|uniref:hypothetical protein n=1 Tax=Acinetobacter sp. ANC 3813 TaxID=1977873 RepID=UPI000A350AEC|nr:hypothetical protein [Acinetobacter sp. ANC 3813]OTG87839.1 hypothetical protein B9T34_16010 [Acinetobacter sp. ANC 3813]
MLFEIINPSDKCTLVADSLELAAVAVCFLGSGKYALKGLDCEHEVPMFFFGGHDEWFLEQFNRNFEECSTAAFEEKAVEMIKIFDGVMIGGADQRELFELKQKDLNEADKKAFRDQWLNERRTSMNNICARAWGIAENVAAKQKEKAGQA